MIPEILGLTSGKPMLLVMNGSVGASGKNLSDDVRLVQSLLNNISPAKGGAAPKLAVDGRCGPLTIAAIRKFQQVNLQGFADGRVDAPGSTIRLLAQSAALNVSLPGLKPATPDDVAATKAMFGFPTSRIRPEPVVQSGAVSTSSSLVGGSRSTGFGAPFTRSGWKIDNNSFSFDVTVKDTGAYVAFLEIFQEADPTIRQKLKIVAAIKNVAIKGGLPVGLDIALPSFPATQGIIWRGLLGFTPLNPFSFSGVCGVSSLGASSPFVGFAVTLFQFQWNPAAPPGTCTGFAFMAGTQVGIPGIGIGGGTGLCLPL